jgi:hypothetical protein
VYRRAGQDSQARKVAVARRTDLRTYGKLNPYRKAGNWLLDKTIKYGYQSWRAGLGLAALFAIFTVLSCFAQHHHLIMPVGISRERRHQQLTAPAHTHAFIRPVTRWTR